MMIPKIMNIRPIILPQVKASPRKTTPTRKTKAGAKLMKGYANVILNFVIAAIQNNEATKADAKPERIKGSIKDFIRNISLSDKSSGRLPNWFNRHFRTIWPYTVKTIVPKIYT